MVPEPVIISPQLDGKRCGTKCWAPPLPHCFLRHLCTPACLVALLIHPRLLWVLSYLPVSCSSTIPCLPIPALCLHFTFSTQFWTKAYKAAKIKGAWAFPLSWPQRYVCMCACMRLPQTMRVGKRSTLGNIYICPWSWHLHHDEMLTCKSHSMS